MFASEVQADGDTRYANQRKFNDDKHVDECFLCGRGLTASGRDNGSWIHMLVSGEFVAQNYTGDDESQGCFPIGSECAKKVPSALRFKMEV